MHRRGAFSPLRPDAMVVVKPAKPSTSRRFVLLGLAGLVIVALTSGIAWFTAHPSFSNWKHSCFSGREHHRVPCPDSRQRPLGDHSWTRWQPLVYRV